MITCTQCKNSSAVQLLNSVLCPNDECKFYDASWAKEVATKKVKQYAKHLSFTFKGTKTGRLKTKQQKKRVLTPSPARKNPNVGVPPAPSIPAMPW